MWIGVVILLLAAWLRLGAFHETLIGADQSSILAAAFDIAAFRSFPVVGIKSSVGVMQTAITPYLAALPLLLVRRVIAIKWFFSALDLLALALLSMAVKRAFGRAASGVAALLYATNPWVVEFIRWIWYQTLVSTFATTAFAAFLLCFAPSKGERRHSWWLAVGMVSATLMGMAHLAALPWTAALCALALGLAWRQRRWNGFGVGLALSLGMIAFPYLLYLLKTSFLDVRLLLAGSGQGGVAWNWATYRLSWELLTGAQVFATPRSPLWAASVADGARQFAPALYAGLSAALGLALAGGLWLCWRRPTARALWGFTLAWTVGAPTVFLLTRFHLQHFYLLFLFPAPYVLIGAGGAVCLTAPRGRVGAALRWGGRLMIALVALLALWWAYIWTVRIGLEQQGLLRAPTRAWLMDVAADRIARRLEAAPDENVIVLTTFDNAHLSPYDWMRNFVNSDRVRVVPVGQGFIIPAEATCYVLAAGASETDVWPVAHLLTERADLSTPATPPWRGYCAPPRAAATQSALAQPVAEWENGLRLLEVAVAPDFAPGATLTLTYTWHYRAVAPRDYHFFNHLLRGETLVAQMDGVGVPPWYWRDDDVLITRFQMQLPPSLEPGTYRLLTGSYTYPEVERVWLVNGEAAYLVERWEIR